MKREREKKSKPIAFIISQQQHTHALIPCYHIQRHTTTKAATFVGICSYFICLFLGVVHYHIYKRVVGTYKLPTSLA